MARRDPEAPLLSPAGALAAAAVVSLLMWAAIGSALWRMWGRA